MAINFPNDPATNPGDGGQWTDPDGNLWQVEIISGEAVWTMIQAAGTDDGGGSGAVDSVNSQTGAVELGVSDMIDVDTDSTIEIYLTPTTEAPYFCKSDGQFNIIADVQSTGPFINIWGLGSDAIKFNKLTIGDSLLFEFPDGVTLSTTYAGDLGALVNNELSVKIGDPWPDEILPGGGVLQPVNGPAFIKVTSSKFNWIEDGQYIAWDGASSKFQALQPPRSGSDLDQVLARSGNRAYYYFSPPTLGDDATDTTVPTMGQVRAAIASNGGTSVALNDLTDVSYNSGDLIVTGLTDISFEGDGKISDGNSNELTFTSTGLTSTGNFDSPLVSTDEVQIKNGSNYISLKAPTLGADVAFNLPGTDGAAASVLTTDGAGNLTFEPIPTVAAPASLYEIDYEGLTAYKFTGPGLDGTELNPAIYVVRGQKYIFSNTLGAHPFQLQTVAGTGESPYTDGVTGDQPIDLGSFEWEVPMDAPSTLYYQCTAHTAMSGVIYVLDNSGGGGAGAVESVNSQTGVVSLGIQDMDDFAFRSATGGTVFRYDNLSSEPGSFGANYNAPGEAALFSNTTFFNPIDSNGLNLYDELVANSDNPTNSTNTTNVWFSTDGVTFTFLNDCSAYKDAAYVANAMRIEVGNYWTPGVDTQLFIAFVNPSSADISLSEGDILQWNNAEQKFKPAALASVATSGDYNDLINAPSAGDAPVTSVNTETGDVSLGIQDMDDFDYQRALPQVFNRNVFATNTNNPDEYYHNTSSKVLYIHYQNSDSVDEKTELQSAFTAGGKLFYRYDLVSAWTELNVVSVGDYLGRSFTITLSAQLTGGYTGGIYIVGSDPAEAAPIDLVNNDILQWNDIDQKFKPTQLDYSQINNTPAPLARTTVEITTAALALGATEAGEITGTGATGLLISAQTDVAVWIRLYTSSAASTQDAGRNKDTDPVPGSGVLFEALYTTFTEKPITPGTTYFNLAGDSKLYYRITNESAIDNTPITVTFKILPLE